MKNKIGIALFIVGILLIVLSYNWKTSLIGLGILIVGGALADKVKRQGKGEYY